MTPERLEQLAFMLRHWADTPARENGYIYIRPIEYTHTPEQRARRKEFEKEFCVAIDGHACVVWRDYASEVEALAAQMRSEGQTISW